MDGRCCEQGYAKDLGVAVGWGYFKQGMLWAGRYHGHGDAVGRGDGMARTGAVLNREYPAGAARGRYLWFPPSQRSRRQCLQARRSARGGGRSGPHGCSEWLACGKRGSGTRCQPGQECSMERPRHGRSPRQLQHHQLGLGGAADDAHDGDGLLVRVPRARVLEERPQLHLIARQVGIAAGQGREGTGGPSTARPSPSLTRRRSTGVC